ncbi:alpha/beta-hydrolase [Pseudovirgaria hyperparasitica]|uniref:Alpha/beta-hydrolase n=1 Tax=Pseudovirgaria hyperparasitica TaxID=470096 RepID=A0A6A6W8Z0_9PEZI|nr:alpha/beta-hydrolase [Pseudovirgaria hyperparasitica]KAF2758057.1 alpha/beta-hydrolase [Pseudovirgaria hyperparasitica]
MANPTPLTAAELQAHPEFKHVTWDLKPEKKESVAVANGRGGPINIAYEVHGHGDIHLVVSMRYRKWVMGLGAFKSAWQRQTKDFAHTQASKYTSLIFDNRGMGESDKPLARYSTSDMALDAIELLDHLGWTGRRQCHIIGISMGGMISQEIAIRIPSRIASLSLVSTAPRLVNTVGFVENIRNRINLFIPRHIDEQLTRVKYNLFTADWCNAPDEHEYTVKSFPTNGDRMMASEITKRNNTAQFTRRGFLLQIIAAGWHHKSDAQLKQIGDEVGRERIMVVHGTNDNMITFPHGPMLLKGLGGEEGGVTKKFIDGQGHMLPAEMRKEFNGWIEDLVRRGEELNSKS